MTDSLEIAAAPSAGLVICAKTGRLPEADLSVQVTAEELLQLTGYTPDFPEADSLQEAASKFDRLPAWDGHEGPRARITIAPGAVGVRRVDVARRERSKARAAARRVKMIGELAAHLLKHGEFPPDHVPQREITEWSRKSRANMTRALCEIDFRPMLNVGRPPAMVTLTYPGDWLTVVPNGRVAKEHLQEFRRRYRRAWGTDLDAVWKLEFQRRGAPHFHLLMVPPRGVARSRSDAIGWGLAFRPWLSAVWADVVNHPDPVEYLNHLRAGTGIDFAEGMRARDPKRVAVYFTKHGTFRKKEYQHVVPDAWQGPGDGPGRFWGYWRVERRVLAVEVAEDDAVWIARVARRWARAQGTTREVRVPRYRGGLPVPVAHDVIGLAGAQLLAGRGRPRYRRVRRRVERLKSGAGWVSVNNGARFAAQIGDYLLQAKAAVRAVVSRLRGEDTHDVPSSVHYQPLLR